SIVPFFQITLDGKIKYSNPALNEILGIISETDLENYNFFANFLKNEKIKSHILKKIEGKGRIENYRLNIFGKDGSEEIYLMDCKLNAADEENLTLLGSIKNITLHSNKEKQLQKTFDSESNANNRDKKQPNLISKLGHELRTPMNSVLGFLTLIENGLFETEEELKTFSRSAKLSAESLLNLLNDIVEFSKIEDDSIDVIKSDFNIRTEIEKIVLTIDAHIKEKELKFEYSISDEVPEIINSDSFKYNQILTNLLTNAITSTSSGNIKLLVSTKKIAKNRMEIVTSVEDTSNGIEQQQLNELMNNNFVSGTNKSKVTTSVLHILICKKLLNLLGGTFEAKSVLGKGSKFNFSIFTSDKNEGVEEQVEVEIEDSKIETDINEKVSDKRPRLLLVEDNPISQKVEKKLLEDAGYSVDCVDNGLDAIEKVKEGKYNLVLMDIELKELNGLETTKIIRELSEDVNKIPIVAVTAQSSMKDREVCLLAGMNDYISKPINITFLKMTIDQWLKESRAK
ncbi:MAG: response regulator, partial [Ignavibacteriae bacterium]|nr:response regulator [Ignavibacteriota bacterium]